MIDVVPIISNRHDSLVPYGPAAQLGRDWCALSADVEFFTNERPPLVNKLVATPFDRRRRHRALKWVAARLSGGPPTTPNCDRI